MAVQGVKSWAGSNESYVGNNCFRMRKLGDGRIRLHIRRDTVRVRDEYIALDPKVEDLVKALDALGFIPKPAPPKPAYKDPFEDC
jgi:hypothetical protein